MVMIIVGCVKVYRKTSERILCKLSQSEILRLYSIIHVAMETTKTSNFTCQSKSFISIFFTWQVSVCELQHFSCHNLANDIYSETAKLCLATLMSPFFLITLGLLHLFQGLLHPFQRLHVCSKYRGEKDPE